MTTQINVIFDKFGGIFLGKQDEIRVFLSKYATRLFKGQVVRDIQRTDATDEIKKSGFRKNVSSWRDAKGNVIISTCLEDEGNQTRYDYTFIISDESYIEKEKPALDIPAPVEEEKIDVDEVRRKQEKDAEKKRLEEEAEKKRLEEEAEKKQLEEERINAEEEAKLIEEKTEEFAPEPELKYDKWVNDIIDSREILPEDGEPIKEFIEEPFIEDSRSPEKPSRVVEWLEQLIFLRKDILFEPFIEEIIHELEVEPPVESIPKPVVEVIQVFEESPSVAQWLEQLIFLRKDIPFEPVVIEPIVEEPIIDLILEPIVEVITVFEASPSIVQWLEQLIFLRKEIPLEPKVLEHIEEPLIIEEPPIDIALIEDMVRKEEEEEELKEKAKEIEKIITIEENVLPLVEEFSTEEILEDISDDMNEMLEKVGGLLEEHRVEVKNEISAKSVLTSTSGEKLELEKKIKIEKTSEKQKVAYSVQSGITNPFDDFIEEAVLTDLIPYSYEITEIQINGTPVKEASKKNLTRDGVEITWIMTDIPPKETININYDLRRRISRTAIFILRDELKIVKTHSNIGSVELEGVFEADLPFSNSFETSLEGVVIEDIVPLYYVHFILEPQNLLPATVIPSSNGELVKWNIGKMDPGTQHYVYKLLNLYKYEELKIAVDELNKDGLFALYKHDFDGTVNKYDEIIELIEKYLK